MCTRLDDWFKGPGERPTCRSWARTAGGRPSTCFFFLARQAEIVSFNPDSVSFNVDVVNGPIHPARQDTHTPEPPWRAHPGALSLLLRGLHARAQSVHIACATLPHVACHHVNGMSNAQAPFSVPAHCHLLAPLGVAAKGERSTIKFTRGGKEYRTEPWAWSTRPHLY